ncbi:MAG: hypothetical protein ACI9JU_002441, partial [Pseudohongiellaceae bacterium]
KILICKQYRECESGINREKIPDSSITLVTSNPSE